MSISGGPHLVSSDRLHHGLPVKKTPSPPFLSRDFLLKYKWPLYFQPLVRLPPSLTCQAGSSNNDWRNPSSPKNNYQGPPPAKGKFKNHEDQEDLLEASQMLSSQNGRSTATNAVTSKTDLDLVVKLFEKFLPLLQKDMNRNRTYGLNATLQKRSKEEREAFQSLLKLLKASGANQKRPTNTDGTNGTISDIVKSLDYDEDDGEDSDSENINETSDPANGVSDVLNSEPVSVTTPRLPSSFSHPSPVPVGKYEPIMPSDTQGGETLMLREEEKSGSESLFYESESESGAEQSGAPHREEKIVNLHTLKVSELREMAKSRGLKGYSKMKKAELVEQLSLS